MILSCVVLQRALMSYLQTLWLRSLLLRCATWAPGFLSETWIQYPQVLVLQLRTAGPVPFSFNVSNRTLLATSLAWSCISLPSSWVLHSSAQSSFVFQKSGVFVRQSNASFHFVSTLAGFYSSSLTLKDHSSFYGLFRYRLFATWGSVSLAQVFGART